MKNLDKGKFYGNSRKQFHVNGLTIVDSEFYQFTNCPWHYHQNAHFAFTTKGNLIETHKNKKIQLSAGCLMYNHSQEPHCNSGYSEQVAALHVDIDAKWFENYGINTSAIEGVKEIDNPVLKNIFYSVFKEVRNFDEASGLAIESMIIRSLNELSHANRLQAIAKPAWIFKIKDLLYDRYNEKPSLEEIAKVLNIHPVYLCQQFPVYFHCSFGDYLRKIKIEKAVNMIFNKKQSSLTNIAYECGFADQSHFIILFKKNIGITPLAFLKLINN